VVRTSQQKTCNISETGQDRTEVTIDDLYRKSHTRFRLVPKSTILDDLEELLRILFQNTCVFRSPPVELVELV